jgi:hypothetical protein
MKKLIAALTLALSALTFQSYSQFITGLGIKGGVTFSNLDFNYKNPNLAFENKNHTGFNGSAFVELIDNKTFNFAFDAGYEQRGYRYEIIRTDEFGNQIGIYDVTNNIHYLKTGFNGKFKYKTKSVSPYIILGPSIDFYLGYNETAGSESGLPEGTEFENSVLEQFKKINYSLNFGAGLEFEKLLPFKTLVEFNYSPPVNTAYNGPYVAVKEHYFNIKLGINFIKEKKKINKK